VAKVTASWRGRSAPPVRLLPELMPYEQLLAQDTRAGTRLVPIGVNEDKLAPVYLDFDADPHFVAFADGESGKTNLLRTIIRGIMTRYSPKEAVILLVDYRRTLLGFIDTDHLLACAVSSKQLNEMIRDSCEALEKRLPGPDVTPEQLRTRSWWKGLELFIVVDDYDLVATPSGNPLQPLANFVAQARDIGLHLIITRRSGGAARSLFDPVISKLKEVSSPGIVMSGSRDEGALLDTVRPSALPPGRGTLVSRRMGEQLMQVAWIQPD
jgi:ESX secretion system protein EccC